MRVVSHKIAWSSPDFFENIRVAVANVRVESANILGNLEGNPNRSRRRFQSFNRLLNDICDEKCDLAVFPEVCVPHTWLRWLSWVAAQREIGLVIGLEHIVQNGMAFNYIATLLPYRQFSRYKTCYVSLRLKRHHAPGEIFEIEGRNLRIPNVKQPHDIFRWRRCTFAVFNCFELTDIQERSYFRGKVDFLVCAEANRDTNYFGNLVESAARDIHCYVIQANDSTFGDSRIVAPSKSEKMNLIRVKGGDNQTFLKTCLPLQMLRQHQLKSPTYQQHREEDFKPTPAGWDRSLVAVRARRPRNGNKSERI